MVERGHPKLSVSRQCEFLGLSRSTYYFRSKRDDSFDLEIKRRLDELYTDMPFYGVPRMTQSLKKMGYAVGERRVRRLMREMGLEAIYPKPRLSLNRQEHRIYPYLLAGMKIERPNKVWCTDITYVPMARGFTFLAAVMDWFSRYVISWRLSDTLETTFCLDALDEALSKGRPEIFNSDQGSQFTSEKFTGRLEKKDVRISMDGRGRVFDNIFIERLWRTVKYEEIYLMDYENMPVAERSLGRYFDFYNHARIHQSLDYATPSEVYFGRN